MEISEKEYFELREQVKQLQEKVDAVKTPIRDLRRRVCELPISRVHNVDNGVPIFGYSHSGSTTDPWTEFIRIAKVVHTPSSMFYMDSSYLHDKYIRSHSRKLPPKTLANMTEEQIEISTAMLNELIPIYNKYFRLTHQEVLYDAYGNGEYERVPVCNIIT